MMDLSGSVKEECDDYPTCVATLQTRVATGRRAATMSRPLAALPRVMTRRASAAYARIRRAPASTQHAARPRPNAVKRHRPFINHVVSPVRTFATATLSLAEVKETGKTLPYVNDVVMASAAGALRQLLLRYDGSAATGPSLHPSRPVRTGRPPDQRQRVGGMAVSLPTHVGDPLERVRLTARAPRRQRKQ